MVRRHRRPRPGTALPICFRDSPQLRSLRPSDTNGGTAPEGARTSFFDVRSPDPRRLRPCSSLPCAVLRPKFTISSMTTLGWSGPSEPVLAARFALIRLTLNRSFLKENPLTQYLDEDRNDPAFLSDACSRFGNHSNGKRSGRSERHDHRPLLRARVVEPGQRRPRALGARATTPECRRTQVGKGARIRFERQLDELHARQPEGAPVTSQQRTSPLDRWLPPAATGELRRLEGCESRQEDQSASFNQPETAKEDLR